MLIHKLLYETYSSVECPHFMEGGIEGVHCTRMSKGRHKTGSKHTIQSLAQESYYALGEHLFLCGQVVYISIFIFET